MLNLPESPLKVPTSRQLRRFARSKQAALGPDLEDFRLDLANGGLSTPWNLRSAILFADRFVETDRYACSNLSMIQKAFRRHLVTLQKHYKASNIPLDAEAAQDIRDAKRQKAREYRRRVVRPLALRPVKTLTDNLHLKCVASSSSQACLRRLRRRRKHAAIPATVEGNAPGGNERRRDRP